ncbi:MAG: recombinase family protein [Candidatus Omnitrophica bacterium]|nr:recombinase family protein [Candidatus Omnitrophota bacterium]
MRVALYIRVSTREQVEGYSLENQKDFLIPYARRNGWEIVGPPGEEIYADAGVSAGTTERPAFQRLLRDAKARRFDLVLVHKLDRFCRSQRDLLNVVTELESFKVGFKSATEDFDTTTSSGRLMLQLLGSFAEFERNRLAERVIPGTIKSVQAGNWHGARFSPYGYQYDKEKKLLEVIPEEAERIKEIFALYLSGFSTQRIAGELGRKGYLTRTGKPFMSYFIGGILKNPVYTGWLCWNLRHYERGQKTSGGKGYRYLKNDPSKVVVAKGKHTPIISKEEFDEVQRRMALHRHGGVCRTSSKEYPLSGILFCGQCGHKFLASSGTSNHKLKWRTRYYRCTARQTLDLYCPNSAVKADLLEPQVYAVMERLLAHPAIRSGRLDRLTKHRAVFPDEKLETEYGELKTRLKQNFSEQDRLAKAYSKGQLAEEVYGDNCITLRAEETRLKRQIAALELQLVEQERSMEYLKLMRRVVDDFDGTKQGLDIIRKKQLLKLIFKRVVIQDRAIRSFELYEPFKTMYAEVISQRNSQRKEELSPTCSDACMSVPMVAR